MKQIFRLVEMSFRKHLLLCLATATLFCRNKLLMQHLITANINLISGWWKSLSSIFQTLLPPKVTFTWIENNEPFVPASANLFLPSEKSMLLFRAFFLLLETMIEIRGN